MLDTIFNPPFGVGKGKLAEDRTHILPKSLAGFECGRTSELLVRALESAAC